jgi:hypothetical protein
MDRFQCCFVPKSNFEYASFKATMYPRHDIARILFVFDIFSGRVSSPPFLAENHLRVSSYSTRRPDFFHIDYHRTNYGAFEPITAALFWFLSYI